MITGHRLLGVDMCLPWIVEYDAVVLTVDYRLAPEFPDPSSRRRSYAGLAWMAEHAEELGVDPGSILIAGASAGGGVSAGTALVARDRKGPNLIGQLLVCPMIDDRDSTVSSTQFTDNTTWSRDSNRFGWSSLLGDRVGTEDVSIYAAPARATELSGLPPTYIDCGNASLPRRGRRVCDEAVGGRRRRGAACVGRRLPRLRHDGPARRREPSLDRRPQLVGRQDHRGPLRSSGRWVRG